ncbi:hypothetical protein Anas_01670 [Armadillidium nasatum]|uniref:EF-hand domain-containing protein n=1 Tax=Armadillidium nasatum TaxID=96803 RepID=A0A5N5TEV2_9CRUS|nr:hypothetical protein Anas_01670 [Armadillidium nasatum]
MINKLDPVVSALNDQKESLEKKLEEGQKDALAETELINLQDLAEHLKHVLSTPDSSKVEKIRSVLAKMDDDMDGAVKAQHVIDVLELLSENPEGLPTKLFEEVVEMMVKEEQLEAQTLAEKALQLASFSQNIRMEGEKVATKTNIGASSPQSDSGAEKKPLNDIEKVIGLKSEEKSHKEVGRDS